MRRFLYLLGIGIILLGISRTPVFALALDPSEVPGDGVYASPEEQEVIWKAIQESEYFRYDEETYGIKWKKETITPIYSIDLMDFAQTGHFAMTQHEWVHHVEKFDPPINGIEERRVYAPEFMIHGYFSDGAFALSTVFTIDLDSSCTVSALGGTGSIEFSKRCLHTTDESSCGAVSKDFYDNVELISAIMGLDDLVPETAARLVHFTGLRGDYGFYVNDGIHEGFFMSDFLEYPENDNRAKMFPKASRDPEVRRGEGLVSVEDLYQQAKVLLVKYENDQKKVEEERIKWEAEHPGETFFYAAGPGGGTAKTDPEDPVEVPVVTAPVATVATPVATAGFTWQTGVAMGAVAVLVLGAAFALSRSRKET